MRFCASNIGMARKHNMPFTTIILTPKASKHTQYNKGSIKFTPKIIDLSKLDADLVLQNFKKGKPVNALELIYLPLYSSSTKTKEELFDSAIKMASESKNRDKIFALQTLLMSTYIDKYKLQKILEENMFKLENNPTIDFFMEKGMEKGMEKRSFEIALEMFRDGLGVETIARYVKMPVEWVEDIVRNADR